MVSMGSDSFVFEQRVPTHLHELRAVLVLAPEGAVAVPPEAFLADTAQNVLQLKHEHGGKVPPRRKMSTPVNSSDCLNAVLFSSSTLRGKTIFDVY